MASPPGQRRTFVVVGAFVMAFTAWWWLGNARGGEPPERWQWDMLTQVNDARRDVGVAPLQPCPALDDVAQAHAQDMANRNFYGHDNPDGHGPHDRIMASRYARGSVVGTAENIAHGQRDVREVMEAWIDSPGHYANIVAPELTHVGFGWAWGSAPIRAADRAIVGPPRNAGFWVQKFGTGGVC